MFGNILCGFFGHHISYNTLFLLHLENMKIYYKDMLHFYQKDEVCIFRYVKVIIKYDEFRNHWKYYIMIDDIHCVVRIIDETKPLGEFVVKIFLRESAWGSNKIYYKRPYAWIRIIRSGNDPTATCDVQIAIKWISNIQYS